MNLLRVLVALALVACGLALAQRAPTIDGRVAAGEYAKTLKHDKSGMTISWSIVGDTIYIALQVDSPGWIGIAMLAEKDDKKKGADSYLFTMDGGKFTAMDMIQVKRTGKPADDTEEGGKNSILQSAGTYAGKTWTVEFSRKLKTGEATDMDIAAGQKFILMIAEGPEMAIKEEHKKSDRWYIENFNF
ncbi:MAG: DOMON domain-containing protein [Meiothermus sp.]|nr:DOMON domain-containing protein [Meiothermus sp.]